MPKEEGQEDEGGPQYKGASNTHELHLLLTDTLMIRRLKKDILTQLPDKSRTVEQVAVMDDAEREALRDMYEEMRRRETESADRKPGAPRG